MRNITLSVNTREFSTILAALRVYSQYIRAKPNNAEPDFGMFIRALATNGGEFKRLPAREVHLLCRRLINPDTKKRKDFK